jgi:transcriptional regulator with XRE-family HTH domain
MQAVLDQAPHQPLRQIGRMAPPRSKLRNTNAFLVEHREARGMKLAEVAAAINAITGKPTQDESTIKRYERGERGLRPEMQRAFAQVFDISVAELFEPPRSTRSIDRHLEGQPPEVWAMIEATVAAILSKLPPR